MLPNCVFFIKTLQTGFPIEQSFIDDLRRHYGNEVYTVTQYQSTISDTSNTQIDLVPVNFARSRTALGLINRSTHIKCDHSKTDISFYSFVARKTKGLIPRMLDRRVFIILAPSNYHHNDDVSSQISPYQSHKIIIILSSSSK